MNIALFSDSYLPTKSGIVTVLIQLKKILEGLGHHVVIVTVETTTEVRRESDSDPNILRLPSLPLGLGTDQFLAFPQIRRIVKFLKTHQIEIIHSHTEFYIGYAAKKAGKKLHIPVIASTHTMWEEFYDHYIPAARLISVQTIRKLVKHLYKNFDAFINVSQKARTYFKNDFMLPQIPSAVIPNAIDTRAFLSKQSSPQEVQEMRKNWGLEEDEIILLFVGRVAQEKRVFELTEACLKIVRKYDKVKALIVGSGPAFIDVEKIVQRAGLDHKIVLTGFVNWTDLHIYYKLSDIFITTSLSEMHSMTILEALLSGLPIVARRDPSYADTIYHEKNGFLAESDAEFTEYVEKLIQDKALRGAFSENSRQIADYFSIEMYGRKTENFYRAVLEAYPKRPEEAALEIAVNSAEI